MGTMQEIKSSLASVPTGASQPAAHVGCRMSPTFSAGVSIHPKRTLSAEVTQQHQLLCCSFDKCDTNLDLKIRLFFLAVLVASFQWGRDKKSQSTANLIRACMVSPQSAVKSHHRSERSQYQLLSCNSSCDAPNKILILCLLFGD